MKISTFTVTLARWGRNVRTLVMQGRASGAGVDDDLEVVQPIGLHARPPVRGSTEALVVELPNGDRFGFPIDKGAAEGAVEAETGETQLYACGNAAVVIRLRPSGDIEITPAEGRKVVLAGGTLDAARATDPVSASGTTAPPTGMAGWMQLITTAARTIAPTIPDPPSTIGTVASGNPRVKA